MAFKPIVRAEPQLMDPRIFAAGRMRLLESLYALDMSKRIHLSPDSRTLYIDLHGVSVTLPEHLKQVEAAVSGFFGANPGLAKRVDVFVNYDGFDCREELVAEFTEMARRCEELYYATVRRVSSAGFSRHKLADAMHVSLQETYTPDEVFELLKSMGHAVSTQTVRTLCARFRRADGAIGKDALEGIVSAVRA